MMAARRLDPQDWRDALPPVRGALSRDGAVADLIWFRTGGTADVLFEPADVEDLAQFLAALPADVPVLALGLGSNLIMRDGGFRGVVVRLGKPFSRVRRDGLRLVCGAGAPGILVAATARDGGVAGLEFLRGIPGTVGGAVRMNAGAYGRETADILVSCTILTRVGRLETLAPADLAFAYRHAVLPEGAVVVEAVFEGVAGDPVAIGAEMDRIAAEREASQPLRSRTGGSTFKNPAGARAWELIDRAGCRGLTRGGAQVSEKHCNFLLNIGGATAADLEGLGEEVRRRVLAATGVSLVWEIARVGEPAGAGGAA